jgi:fumarate reductase flavoprotein subunit
VAQLKREMNTSLEDGCGIYRDEKSLRDTVAVISDVRARYRDVSLEDKSSVYNTDLYQTLELGAMIECAETVVHSALQRTESRGAHQRLDFVDRDDANFLKHSMAYYNPNGEPRIDYHEVVITKSPPAARVYGAAAGGQAA